ncbi:MAG TPA: GNAT family N-acetyltransferase [Xanthomonadales bacterium]|nr:GNAT family N-acetyltransferase [Xanthomonadales bacterium]
MPQPAALHIRPAIREDCALILRFIQGLADYEKLAHRVVATEAQLAATLFAKRPGAEVLIAEWSGEAAGFALHFPNYSTFLARPGIYLEDLFVHPEFRGHGIGKALLQRLAQIAVERDCGRLDWSVLDWNEPAIEFYRSIGARALDDWTTFRVEGTALSKLTGQP